MAKTSLIYLFIYSHFFLIVCCLYGCFKPYELSFQTAFQCSAYIDDMLGSKCACYQKCLHFKERGICDAKVIFVNIYIYIISFYLILIKRSTFDSLKVKKNQFVLFLNNVSMKRCLYLENVQALGKFCLFVNTVSTIVS